MCLRQGRECTTTEKPERKSCEFMFKVHISKSLIAWLDCQFSRMCPVLKDTFYFWMKCRVDFRCLFVSAL